MSIKYKIDDAKKNKNLINNEIKLSRIKSKGGPTTKPRVKAPSWFVDFRNEMMQRSDRQDKRFDKLEKDVSNLRNDFDRVVKLNNLKY